MRPVTIGTAGHIDHGKSALVRALTGIDPDRLAEEQRRGMTLDLGFAHLDLPSGVRVGIVDVPGHEALVHNMLAGAGGLDLVMLVVAADEGVMPQTREHLDILRFLPVTGGVVVLTKADLVSEPEWLEIVSEEIRALVIGSPLEGAPVVAVSAKTGEGLPALVAILDSLVAALPARDASGPVRLPLDRAFTIQGFGTVVTGTLWSGTVRPGDALEILPAGRSVRVRGLQVHGETVREAWAGSRVAVNLSGVEKHEVERGDVLATPGAFRPTTRLDVRLQVLPAAPALRHGAPVHVHLGAGVAVGRVVLADRHGLAPSSGVLAEIRLERPVVAVHGDRFVIRRYSPTQTLGGGIVLRASPPRRERRAEIRAVLEAVEREGPVALVVAAVTEGAHRGLAPAELPAAAGLAPAGAAEALERARATGAVVRLAGRLYAAPVVARLRQVIEQTLDDHHRTAPWRRGIPREELKTRVADGGDHLFDAVLADLLAAGSVVIDRGFVARAGFTPVLTDAQRRLRDLVLAELRRTAWAPPTVDELKRLGPASAVEAVLQVLADDGEVVVIAPDLRIATSALDAARRTVVAMAAEGDEITVASLRDRLGTSRRYALALLEYFDAMRVTRRVGDRRVLGPEAAAGPRAPG
ncbi:MAG: selenocysteine-specific translation elongation factor [Armatimonadota bacterium]|nr:selenocysteine-specific translation elongation factor [Armatimonadota bacterium]MDR7532334.1 selenocysteine-specific translation elongation factor [Armatimonadota bacterium]MDR7535261.1 selenocysteine-specific translation elongation factor [Armatimonadota bacterium]